MPLKTLLFLIPILLLASCGPPRENRIIIGSKNFTEQAILGEIFRSASKRRRTYTWSAASI